MQQQSTEQKRYVLELACGHSRRTEFPPMGRTYPCGECPGFGPSPRVEAYTDTITERRTELRRPAA